MGLGDDCSGSLEGTVFGGTTSGIGISDAVAEAVDLGLGLGLVVGDNCSDTLETAVFFKDFGIVFFETFGAVLSPGAAGSGGPCGGFLGLEFFGREFGLDLLPRGLRYEGRRSLCSLCSCELSCIRVRRQFMVHRRPQCSLKDG